MLLVLFIVIYDGIGVSIEVSSLNPSYYVIGENMIVEIPSNTGEVGSSIIVDDIKDVEFSDGSVSVSSCSETIVFSIPNNDEFVDIQEIIYNLS